MSIYSQGVDPFQTQADTRFNSFSDPTQGMNANMISQQQGWGANPAYMTPSYLSPYRPQFNGIQGSPYGTTRPGFWSSANYLFNPFAMGGENYGGNQSSQINPYIDSFVQTPFDKSMRFAQNYALPAYASIKAYQWFGGAGGAMERIGGSLGSGAMRGMASVFGANPSVTGTAMSFGRGLGGLVGSNFGPMMIAQGAVSAANAFMFEPYRAQRNITNNMRRDFSGIAFGQAGEGDSDYVTGGGLSHTAAARIASRISGAGARDITFTSGEMSTIADYSARSGLLDNAGGADQITKRILEVTKGVKVMMQVANTSDFKQAIGEISKLVSAGVSFSDIGRIGAALRGSSSASGISYEKFMSTTGLQGQMMFQANGMTPYVGALVAGQMQSSFATAKRAGLLSNQLLARMGGVEGATQSATAGMLNLMQSPYMSMMGMNAFFGKGDTGNLISNMAQFGNRAAMDPLEAIGNMNYVRPALLSKMMESNGAMLAQNGILDIANSMHLTGPGGKVSAGKAFEILTKQMGMPEDNARAMLTMFSNSQNKKAVDLQLAGIDRQRRDDAISWMTQTDRDYGSLTGPANWISEQWRSTKGTTTDLMSGLNEYIGGGADSVQKGWFGLRYSGFNGPLKVNDLEARYSPTGVRGRGKFSSMETYDSTMSKLNLMDSAKFFKNWMAADTSNSGMASRLLDSKTDSDNLDKIKKLAEEGDENALKLLNASPSDITTRRNAIESLVSEKKIDSRYGYSNTTDNSTGSTIERDRLLARSDLLGKTRGDPNASSIDQDLKFSSLMAGYNPRTAAHKLPNNTSTADIFSIAKYTSAIKTLANKGLLDDKDEEIKSAKAVIEKSWGKESVNNLDSLADIVREGTKNLVKTGLGQYDEEFFKKTTGRSADDLQKEFAATDVGTAEEQKAKKNAFSQKYTKQDWQGTSMFAARLAKDHGYDLRLSSYSGSTRGLSTEDMARLISQQEEYSKQSSYINDLYKNQKIDFTTANQMMAGLDSKTAAGDFRDSVRRFGEAVDKMPGSGEGIVRKVINYFGQDDTTKQPRTPGRKPP
jgi:hypothetical protein